MGKLVDECTPYQKFAGILSMCLSAAYMIVAFFWSAHDNTVSADGIKSGFLSGLTTNKCTQHAALMILGMGFSYTWALMSYRVFHVLGHTVTKIFHGILHTCTLALVVASLVLIIQFHNDHDWGHLTSMHSWCGLVLLAVYFQNWLLGSISYGLGCLFELPLEWKKKYMPSHRFLGIVGFFLAAVTMELGIQQKQWLDGTFGCIYTITNNSQRTNPAAAYSDISEGCQYALGIGLMIALNAVISMYALWDFNSGIEKDQTNSQAVDWKEAIA